MCVCMYFLKKGGEGGRRGKETSICERYIDWLPLTRPQLGTWPATQTYPLTGNLTSDLSIRRLVLTPLSHTSQGRKMLILTSLYFPLRLFFTLKYVTKIYPLVEIYREKFYPVYIVHFILL